MYEYEYLKKTYICLTVAGFGQNSSRVFKIFYILACGWSILTERCSCLTHSYVRLVVSIVTATSKTLRGGFYQDSDLNRGT